MTASAACAKARSACTVRATAFLTVRFFRCLRTEREHYGRVRKRDSISLQTARSLLTQQLRVYPQTKSAPFSRTAPVFCGLELWGAGLPPLTATSSVPFPTLTV